MSRAISWVTTALFAWAVVWLLWAGGMLALAVEFVAAFVMFASISDLTRDPSDGSALCWTIGSAVVVFVVGLVWL